jgi:hypothetical protein
MKTTWLVVMTLFLASALSRPVCAQLVATDAITARAIRGSGGWKSDGKETAAAQQWSLNVTRGDDNSIRGRVTLSGSPLASAGNVSGHIIGTTVSGTITDDDGKQIATFQGTASKAGMSGKYTDRTGETGEWSWQGNLPE